MPQPRPVHSRVILLQSSAPAKPKVGSACNGCGVCCAAQPCPLGILLSRRRSGACKALIWHSPESRYLCGALAEPWRWLPWLPRRLATSLVRRWIRASVACDADLSATPATQGAEPASPTEGPGLSPGGWRGHWA